MVMHRCLRPPARRQLDKSLQPSALHPLSQPLQLQARTRAARRRLARPAAAQRAAAAPAARACGPRGRRQTSRGARRLAPPCAPRRSWRGMSMTSLRRLLDVLSERAEGSTALGLESSASRMPLRSLDRRLRQQTGPGDDKQRRRGRQRSSNCTGLATTTALEAPIQTATPRDTQLFTFGCVCCLRESSARPARLGQRSLCSWRWRARSPAARHDPARAP
jgi:hypothetical protein